MSELMLVSLVTVIDKTKVGSAASNGDPIRYQYSKIGFMSMKFVIVDVLPDGYKEWWEQESGEVVWHFYYPSLAERTAFHRFIAGRKYEGWPLLTIPVEMRQGSDKKQCTSFLLVVEK